MSEDWKKLKRRLDRLVGRARKVSASPKVRTISLLVILPVFVTALVFAWRESDFSLDRLALVPTLFAAGLVPISVFASTWQLRTVTRLGGEEVKWWEACRVVTVGTLSGLLPVSSGTLVRGTAVVYWGVAPRRAGHVLIYDVLIWMCVSLLFSGSAALSMGATTTAFLLLGGGAALLPLSILIGRWLKVATGHGALTAARGLGVLALTLQLQACFWALGAEIGFVHAASLAAAIPLASLLFFLPGSLGVQELFIAALATAVGMNTALTMLAAVLARLIGLSTLVLWESALVLGRSWKSHSHS